MSHKNHSYRDYAYFSQYVKRPGCNKKKFNEKSKPGIFFKYGATNITIRGLRI